MNGGRLCGFVQEEEEEEDWTSREKRKRKKVGETRRSWRIESKGEDRPRPDQFSSESKDLEEVMKMKMKTEKGRTNR